MTTFEIPTLDELTDFGAAYHQNLLPEDDVSKFSDSWKRIRVTSGLVADAHRHVLQGFRDAMPTLAKGTALQLHADDTWGLPRTSATVAVGTNAVRVRGTAGSTFTTSDILEHVSGAQYRPSLGGTIPASGFLDISIQSITLGPDAALEADGATVLSWQTPPSGIEDDALLVADLTGGLDQEAEGNWQKRLLELIAAGALGGASADFKKWILESTDPVVQYAFAWAHRAGRGSVDVAALFDGQGATRLLDSIQRGKLLTRLNGLRPVTATVRVLEVVTQAQDVEVTIIPQDGEQFASDWDDSTPLTVSSYTASTRTLVFSTDRPASMTSGHRLIVAGFTGEQAVIESLSGTDTVILADPVPYVPTGGETVYSGGPILAAARQALLDHFNKELGPRRGDFAGLDWVSTLYVSNVFKLVQLSEGVLDSTVVTPGADVVPTQNVYPDDDKVNLLVPGEVLVRYE